MQAMGAPSFERTLVALMLSAACPLACGGVASERSAGTGGSGAGFSASGAAGATSGGATGAAGAGTAGGAGLSCDQARDDYAALVASLLSESSSTACSVSSDCGFIPTSDCGNGCSTSIGSTAASAAISSQLGAFAKANCELCDLPSGPCAAPYFPALQCVAGACTL